ncbi:MAG: DUF4190 domain-containing protein [Roseburia sp.]
MDYNDYEPTPRRGSSDVVIKMGDSRRAFAIASLVLGILSMTLCCVIGWLPGLIGLILAAVSLAKKWGGTGMAIAGLVTSILGILVGVYVAVCTIIGVSSPDFQGNFRDAFQQSYYEQTGEYYDFGD